MASSIDIGVSSKGSVLLDTTESKIVTTNIDIGITNVGELTVNAGASLSVDETIHIGTGGVFNGSLSNVAVSQIINNGLISPGPPSGGIGKIFVQSGDLLSPGVLAFEITGTEITHLYDHLSIAGVAALQDAHILVDASLFLRGGTRDPGIVVDSFDLLKASDILGVEPGQYLLDGSAFDENGRPDIWRLGESSLEVFGPGGNYILVPSIAGDSGAEVIRLRGLELGSVPKGNRAQLLDLADRLDAASTLADLAGCGMLLFAGASIGGLPGLACASAFVIEEAVLGELSDAIRDQNRTAGTVIDAVLEARNILVGWAAENLLGGVPGATRLNILGTVLKGAALVVDEFADDPPAGDYDIVSDSFLPPLVLDFMEDVDSREASLEVLNDAFRLLESSALSLIALERYQGAIRDGEFGSAVQQLGVYFKYADVFENTLVSLSEGALVVDASDFLRIGDAPVVVELPVFRETFNVSIESFLSSAELSDFAKELGVSLGDVRRRMSSVDTSLFGGNANEAVENIAKKFRAAPHLLSDVVIVAPAIGEPRYTFVLFFVSMYCVSYLYRRLNRAGLRGRYGV